MKKVIVLLFLLGQTLAFSQSEAEVKKLLLKKFPDKSAVDEWVFVKDEKILQFNIPFIKDKLNHLEFYKAFFFNFADGHIFNDWCIVMFNKTNKSIVMLPPIWYSGIPEAFYQKFIGIQLADESERKAFAPEFAAILMNESGEHIKETVFENDAITFKIVLNTNDDGDLHDMIKVVFKDNTITEIQRICVKHLDVEKSIK